MKISPARLAAFEVLRRVEVEQAYTSVLLPLAEEHLSDLDRRLCHQLVLGVLRTQIYLDSIITSLAGKKKIDIEVRLALRLGIYQILLLDRVPDYSAINESVNLVQKAGKTSAKGFVNAILRRLTKGFPPMELDEEDDLERISVESSHPQWLVETWIKTFGVDDAEEIAFANNKVSRIAYRFVNDGSTSPDLERSEIVGGCYFASSTDAIREQMEAGQVYRQDEASQLVAQAVSQDPARTFLDVCAAPGGKTTQIAKKLGDHALIVAGDVHAARIRLLRSTCESHGADSVNIVQYDAEIDLPFPDQSFETVFVDAPCTGTGTIRHNPEIRYSLKPADIVDLSNKQRRILKNASKLVKPCGRLIYSTCSLQVEENEDVCLSFLTGVEGFTQIRPQVPERFITGRNFARTFPHRDAMDGFFIAAFERSPQ